VFQAGGGGASPLSRRRFLSRAGRGLAGAGLLGLVGPVDGALANTRVVGPLDGALANTRGARTAHATLPTLPSTAASSHGSALVLHTEPHLHPPAIAASGASHAAPGYLFIGPQDVDGLQAGPLILDSQGQPVYSAPVGRGFASNVAAWSYRGAPVLAYWEGAIVKPGYGKGQAYLLDSSYKQVARIGAAGGRTMDLHELQVTSRGTALFTCTPLAVSADLSAVGGPRHGTVLESVFQEVDIATGKLVLEWRSLQHIPLGDSYLRPSQEPYDYAHLNSVVVCPDGDLLISVRHTWALYKLDRSSGRVIWRLGGKRSNFPMGPGARFSWQHDGGHPSENTITVFDDGYNGFTRTESQSRGLVLEFQGKRVRLAQELRHPKPSLSAEAMGSVQLLPDGHALVGWGFEPYVSEFSSSSQLLTDYRLPANEISYRARRLPWSATPSQPPAIAAQKDAKTGEVTLYASWNGSTETVAWLVSAGAATSALKPVGAAARRGFETGIALGRASGYATVSALDIAGATLATSKPVAL
jgi:hypothetical protein